MATAKFRIEGEAPPGELIIVQGFLNTWSQELDIEDFATPAATQAWLCAAGLWSDSEPLNDEQHKMIIAFRRALRAWIRDNEDLTALMQVSAPLTFRAEFSTTGELNYLPTGDSYQRAIGKLVTIISNSIQAGTWQRLKCCGLASCGWSFYDNTRSRTKRWCSMRTCGSRHKARAYYKRKTSKHSDAQQSD